MQRREAFLVPQRRGDLYRYDRAIYARETQGFLNDRFWAIT